jgi:hypothetical protein
VLDGAEVFLCSRDDLRRVAEKSAGICAILAMETLDPVEVAKVVAIESDVVSPTYFGDAIDWKRLV